MDIRGMRGSKEEVGQLSRSLLRVEEFLGRSRVSDLGRGGARV